MVESKRSLLHLSELYDIISVCEPTLWKILMLHFRDQRPLLTSAQGHRLSSATTRGWAGEEYPMFGDRFMLSLAGDDFLFSKQEIITWAVCQLIILELIIIIIGFCGCVLTWLVLISSCHDVLPGSPDKTFCWWKMMFVISLNIQQPNHWCWSSFLNRERSLMVSCGELAEHVTVS